MPIATPTEMARLTPTLRYPAVRGLCPQGRRLLRRDPLLAPGHSPYVGFLEIVSLGGGGGDQSELDGNGQNPLGHQQHVRSTSPRGSPAWAGGAETLRTVAGEETSGCSPAARRARAGGAPSAPGGVCWSLRCCPHKSRGHGLGRQDFLHRGTAIYSNGALLVSHVARSPGGRSLSRRQTHAGS